MSFADAKTYIARCAWSRYVPPPSRRRTCEANVMIRSAVSGDMEYLNTPASTNCLASNGQLLMAYRPRTRFSNGPSEATTWRAVRPEEIAISLVVTHPGDASATASRILLIEDDDSMNIRCSSGWVQTSEEQSPADWRSANGLNGSRERSSYTSCTRSVGTGTLTNSGIRFTSTLL